jgi:casein kinase I family protein HRR25
VFDWTVYKYQKNAQAIAQAANQGQGEEDDKGRGRHVTTTAAANPGTAAGTKRGPVNARQEGTGM